MKTKLLLVSFLLLGSFAFSQSFPASGLGKIPINNQHGLIRGSCEVCPENSLFSNGPIPIDYAGTSDDQSCFTVYDNFSNVSSSIGHITFWGYELHFGSPCSFFCDCTPSNPKTFEIKFYTDNAGAVGTPVSSFTVTPTKEFCMTVDIYDTVSMFRYDANLAPAFNLTAGWVSIRAVGGTDACWFLWAGSDADDMFAYQPCDGESLTRSQDFAFCLGSSTAVPIANWALILGVVLIGTFVFIRYRRMV
jgi:hypothetical protein